VTDSSYTHITVILDKSGSMEGLKADALGGFNSFVEQQASIPGKVELTLIQFNHNYEISYKNKKISTVPKLTEETFRPVGYTALYDAIGRGITETGQFFAALPEDARPGKVVFVIITDGAENSSHEYTHERIKNMIAEQTDKYSWNFTYLGANQDAFVVGSSMNIPNSATYSTSKAKNAFDAVSVQICGLRSSSGTKMQNYSAAQLKSMV
jgi:hypothetical protein